MREGAHLVQHRQGDLSALLRVALKRRFLLPGLLGTMIRLMNTMAWLLPLLAIVLLGGGIAVAASRRKAVLWMGVGIIALTIIPVQAIYLGQIPFASAALALAQMPNAAAQAAYTTIFANLIRANQLVAVIGLIFWVGAILAGPSKWATALRNGFRHGAGNIGPDWDFGVAGQFFGRPRPEAIEIFPAEQPEEPAKSAS